MGLKLRIHVNQFQIDLYMVPNLIGAFLFTNRKRKT
jgi:hypothetical protein